MTKLVPLTLCSNVATFCVTQDPCWLGAAGFILAIPVYTVLLMKGSSIDPLLHAEESISNDKVGSVIQLFCNQHHARLAFAVGAVSTGLVACATKTQA